MISGTADIIIGGNRVAGYTDKAAFGELALMYNAPRAATIKAVDPCMCYTLDMRSFRFILSASASTGLMAKTAFLKKVRISSWARPCSHSRARPYPVVTQFVDTQFQPTSLAPTRATVAAHTHTLVRTRTRTLTHAPTHTYTRFRCSNR